MKFGQIGPTFVDPGKMVNFRRVTSVVSFSTLKMRKSKKMSTCIRQTSIKCATARPSVIDSEGPSSIIKDPNIRSFVAKSVLARFTRFLGVRTQPLTLKAQTKHCQIGQLHY